MNKFQLTFTALKIPLDAIMLALAAFFSYSLRYSRYAMQVRPILQNIPISSYIQLSLTFILIWLIVFIIAGLYSTRQRKAWDELGKIILACTTGVMILISIVFFKREITQSRFIILAIWGLSILFVVLGRLFLRTVQHILLKMNYGHQKIAIIGNDDIAHKLNILFTKNPILGFSINKHIKSWNPNTKKQLKNQILKNNLNGIILADPNLPKNKALHIIAFANKYHLNFWYAADIFAANFTNIEVTAPGGIPLIEVKPTPLDGWGRIVKRIEDVILASLFIILSSPLWIIASILIVIEDGFPILYKNERIGEKGKKITTYKLRSMYKKFSIGQQFKNNKQNLKLEKELIKQQSIKKGPVYKIQNDPRVTKVGKFIRRWSIDELANFISVIKGDMSLIGPRPHQPREVENYTDEQRRVLAIQPGVTGLSQISGRSDLSFEEEVRLDTWYIKNWSLLLDLYILLKTPFVIIYKTGAY